MGRGMKAKQLHDRTTHNAAWKGKVTMTIQKVVKTA